jgi:uncharacterized protein YutE (UPF0331/DUF86 family)
LVDAESITERLGRLERWLELLEEVRAGGENAYRRDERLRAATERWLQLAEQACIDMGARLVSEVSAPPPADYAGIFSTLAATGHLDPNLVGRLVEMAWQRNLLIHAYLDIDDRKVFESLDHLEDLRAFAATVQRLVDTDLKPERAGKVMGAYGHSI